MCIIAGWKINGNDNCTEQENGQKRIKIAPRGSVHSVLLLEGTGWR